MKSILVVGGAGYIGSHMVRYLADKGCEVTVLDNLSNGYQDAVDARARFVHGDMASVATLSQLFSSHRFDAVMHFASSILVGESVQQPLQYYRNNVSNTINLLEMMVHHDVKRFIFSSTAAIFGNPLYSPIDEEHPKAPINPYGQTKLAIEHALRDSQTACGLESVSLRYFNAAGAHPDGSLGERHEPETHLIPLILQAASGRRDKISIFGTDYDTPDGSCIRDYIHVQDLCDAHWLALEYLFAGKGTQQFNLGNGAGYSVKEVIAAVREVTGKDITVVEAERRAGDPPRLVANAQRAMDVLGWKPQFAELNQIIEHAWAWEEKHFGS